MMRTRALGLGSPRLLWGLLAIVSLPATASAGNGIHPRTPVEWKDVPCMTIVDRSAEPVLHVPYGIPYEDERPEDAIDEVETSRRHQFFALCRQRDRYELLPTWITQADVDDAASWDLVDPAMVEPSDVFETATAWQDCWFRITPDDPRRAISEEMAMAGVDWDTSTVPVGVYQLAGYTWEPAFNLWKERPGTVKVVDGLGTDEDDPPAVAVTPPDAADLVLYKTGRFEVTGCVDALDGATLSASWTRVVKAGDPPEDWHSFLDGEPASDGMFSFEFDVPDELEGESTFLKVELTDALDRTRVAYLAEALTILAGSDPDACDTDGGGSFISPPGCHDSDGDTGSGTSGATGSGTTTDEGSASGSASTTSGTEEGGSDPSASGSGSGDSTTGDSGAAQGADASGCACASGRGTRSALSTLPWLVLARRRRRG